MNRVCWSASPCSLLSLPALFWSFDVPAALVALDLVSTPCSALALAPCGRMLTNSPIAELNSPNLAFAALVALALTPPLVCEPSLLVGVAVQSPPAGLVDTDVVSHGFARSRQSPCQRSGWPLSSRTYCSRWGPRWPWSSTPCWPSRPSDCRCSSSLPNRRRLMRGRHVRCCEQNECISIEQLYI